jgi:hypothetical protein
MFNIDERCLATGRLGFGNCRHGQRCLAGGLSTEDFDDSTAWKATDAKRKIKRYRTRRNSLDSFIECRFAESHNSATAECFLDLCES